MLQAGCLGIFDGHHGVQAAAKARELVPPTLRAKLAEVKGLPVPRFVTCLSNLNSTIQSLCLFVQCPQNTAYVPFLQAGTL